MSRGGRAGGATVDRVLPWRRVAAPADEVAPLLGAYRRRHPRARTALISRAYAASANAHTGQFRSSGETYIAHPLAVAQIVADLGLDDVSVAAALLHDAVEDTTMTLEDIRSSFGTDVEGIVDGLTKLDRLDFATDLDQQAATMRKMLVAMARDLRVLIIKLADRLHNMRTLAALPAPKQRRIAEETRGIYAPLAHRLGMQGMRQQLDDLAFATLHPKRYAEIEQMVSGRDPERELYLAQVLPVVKERLAELKLGGEVSGRPKHLWSIYDKMVMEGKELDAIFDLVGIRVLVDRVEDCYAALGSIHAIWKPVQGRFKDYIAMPKFNLYQSLHTTVVGPQGKSLEVQIRTREMHRRAEFGVAAHWAYKERDREGVKASDLPWLDRIADVQSETSDAAQFMQTLKVDLVVDEIFVFTPKGKVVTLPDGATPIDFAYAIHTEVGHACVGARVDGRLRPLNTTLHSGETVTILTSKASSGPSRDWLGLVATSRARTKIRHWFSKERREDALESGREALTQALRRAGLPADRLKGTSVLEYLARDLGYSDPEGLQVAIGEHKQSAQSVAQRAARALRSGETEEQLPATVRAPRRRQAASVHVENLDDVMVRLSRCCTPVPDDEIMGFITLGRGVSVHRADCANAVALAGTQGDRLIEVAWNQNRGHADTFVVSIEVKALDRSRLLRDVSASLSEHHVNILACATQTGSDRVSRMRFDFELADPGHLESLITTIRRIESVYDAYRLLPGRKR